jgi:crotonobetainyl-CoA hydratase
VSGLGKVLVERAGREQSVMVVTINREEARNAIDHDVCVGVGDAVSEAEDDRSIRVLILTGAGDRAFSAGADLKAIMRGERILPEGRERWSLASFVNHFTTKPTIAAVNGAALGGGTELALACDLVVASEAVTFGLPEVKRGLVAGAGGAFRLPQQLPHRLAMRLLLTGEDLSATDALRWGLINELVPTSADVLPVAMKLADAIAANAPLAVQATKRIAMGASQGTRPDETPLWELTDTELAEIITTQDAVEGPQAFAEKRPPVWQSR